MEDHGEKRGHGTDPKEGPEKRREGAPNEKSEEGPGEQSERKAQEEQNGRHHSTWSGKKQWKRKRGQGTAKVQKKRSNLRDRRTRNRVPMTTAPGSVDRPLRLIIHSGGSPSAAGKLTSHCQRESEGLRGSFEIRNAVRRSTWRFWRKRWKWGCLTRPLSCIRNTGTATRSSRNQGR